MFFYKKLDKTINAITTGINTVIKGFNIGVIRMPEVPTFNSFIKLSKFHLKATYKAISNSTNVSIIIPVSLSIKSNISLHNIRYLDQVISDILHEIYV